MIVWRRPRRPGLGASALGRSSLTSESSGAGAPMIPRLLGFVPGVSPLTHWLPGRPAGFSCPLSVLWK